VERPKQHFKPSISAETQFARALRWVAKVSGHIVEAHTDGVKIRQPEEMKRALHAYSQLIDPWARRQANKMLVAVAKSNSRAYRRRSKEIGKLLKANVAEREVGETAAKLMTEQVELIKSIPLKAGQRAQELSMRAVYEGKRADQVAEELAASGKVSESDAMLIARTEVARANASITQARAEAAGSLQYRWRNSGDESVREAHKRYKGRKLDGQIFSWDSPPTLDDGTTGHPGTFPNCRCYPEPVF
jgi:SPP1 gp7 family putative phage head morphogenesis protein